MRVALCAIAKDEDAYLAEWCDYHRRLGADAFHVIQQGGWKWRGGALPGLELSACGDTPQCEALNARLDEIRGDCAWVLFFDVDEFLAIPSGKGLKAFLDGFPEATGIAFNWRVYGGAGVSVTPEASVLKRFRRCRAGLEPDVKCALHTAVAPKEAGLVTPHCLSLCRDPRERIVTLPGCVNAAGEPLSAPPGLNLANLPDCLESAWLAHFRTKSRGEYERKVLRGAGYFYPNKPAELEWRLGLFDKINAGAEAVEWPLA